MNKRRSVEIDILDRIMWLLEEGSVRHAAQNDEAFARYIEALYAQVGHKAASLRAA